MNQDLWAGLVLGPAPSTIWIDESPRPQHSGMTPIWDPYTSGAESSSGIGCLHPTETPKVPYFPQSQKVSSIAKYSPPVPPLHWAFISKKLPTCGLQTHP